VDLFALACEVEADGDRDGIPNVVVEAMASGLPVVSTTVSGLPECVDHGVTGLLVPERQPRALADAIGLLLSRPEMARALGRAGRAKVEREFAAHRNVLPIAAALHEALALPFTAAEVSHAVGG
jgi:glycosyltransferase involved in cell wall biosynthesis